MNLRGENLIMAASAREGGKRKNKITIIISEINRLSEILNVPLDLKDQAFQIYDQAASKKLTRGRDPRALAAACLYASMRKNNFPRSLEEVAKVSGLPKRKLGKYYRHLVLGISLKIPIASPADYLRRFSKVLELSPKSIKKALEILDQAKEKGITDGKDPAGLAAAAIYMATLITGEHRTQDQIAAVAHVTEVTVRNRYKELVRKFSIDRSNPGILDNFYHENALSR